LQGQQTAHVKIGYAYDALYQAPPSFPQSFGIPSGISFAGVGARFFVVLNQDYKAPIGAWDARAQAGLGGWTLSPHHAYDPVGKILYLGDGTRRSAENIDPIMSTFAALSSGFENPYKVAVGPDGMVYAQAGSDGSIYRFNPDGTKTRVAGGGLSTAEGVPATQANLSSSPDFEIASDGSIYVVEAYNRVRRIGLDGLIRTVAGTGACCFSGDGGPATQAQLSGVIGIALGPDGSLYIGDKNNNCIRRVGADGRIATIAGNGQSCFRCAGSGPAPQAAMTPSGDVEVGPDGSVYFGNSDHIFRVPPDASAIRQVVGGGGQFISNVNGVPATDIHFGSSGPGDISIGADGLMYLSATDGVYNFVLLVDHQGLIYKVAGKETYGFGGDRGPARQALMNHSDAVAVGPDGAVYIADRLNGRIRKVSAPLPGFSGGDITIPSEDGALLYRFSPQGRHLSTINALTSATLLTFGYDSAGRLLTITDADNNVTTIERDSNGAATGILSAFGQRTTLALDSGDFLASATNPAGETVQLTYNSTGLLTKLKDPRNNEYLFEYDALGRLTRDTDPASGFQSLALTESGVNGSTKEVRHNTTLNRNTLYRVEQLQSGIERRTNIAPDGTQSQHSFGADRTHTIASADGSTNAFTETGDPRFGMGAPFIKSQTVSLPSGLQMTTSHNRTVQLSDPTSLASLVSISNTLTINGLNYTANYDAATRTYTTGTPLGKQTTTLIDSRGRATQAQAGGLNATSYVYDARGRLSSTTTGAGAEARTFSAAYNAQGFLANVTDEINRTASYTYDTVGRILTKTFPDNRVVSFGYDASGNLTSLTPPGRPAHQYTYNSLDLVTSYTPPDVGAGAQPITYTYNLDQQLTREARPGGVNIDFAYNTAGQLTGIHSHAA
jgi:YD repeat-containing protein